MVIRQVGIIQPLLSSDARNRIGHYAQLATAGVTGHKRLGRTFKIVHLIEGESDGWSRHQHSVIAHHQDALVAEHSGQPLTFLVGQRHPAEGFIHCHSVIEPHGVLVDRVHRAVVDTGEGDGEFRVQVHHASGTGQQCVQSTVDVPSGRVGRVRATQGGFVFGIE
jgi:hypothetical protein